MNEVAQFPSLFSGAVLELGIAELLVLAHHGRNHVGLLDLELKLRSPAQEFRQIHRCLQPFSHLRLRAGVREKGIQLLQRHDPFSKAPV